MNDEQEQSQSDQILTNTEWRLEYAVIDGQEHDRTGWLSFYDTSIYISDSCAGKWYENIGDGAVYLTSEQGNFALAEDKNVFADHWKWVVCEQINPGTGVTKVVTSPWFSTVFESVVAYDLQDHLLLCYPEDK